MSMFQIFKVSGSAVSAQSQRLNVVASNLANVDTVAGPDGQAVPDLARKLPGRGEIPLEVRGREREARGDVVEAVVGFVRQQQCRRVHLQREDVTDGVGVFGAVQPMGAHARRLLMGRGG
ncbi:MAG: flagellar basal body protein, partial [Polaromonas sp.]|nr:flagellar basal body protein [Polaromonas sp.]